MKTLLSAVLMLSGAVASAETLVADIPFAFQVPGAQLQAGKYTLTRADAPNYDAFYIRSDATRKAFVFATPIRTGSGPMNGSHIKFRCAATCELAEIQSESRQMRNGVTPSRKRITGTEISWRSVTVTAAE